MSQSSPPPASQALDCPAQRLAETALELDRSHPHVPALDVLDLAMQGHTGEAFPDFDRPGLPPACSAFLPSPFASLLRRAFMPTWTDADFAPVAVAADTSGQMWALQVLAPFAERYALVDGRARWHYQF